MKKVIWCFLLLITFTGCKREIAPSLEIINPYGHPKYYDSMKEANEYWKDEISNDLVNTHSLRFKEKNIMHVFATGDVIDEINISFYRIPDIKVSMDLAKKIAYDYSPTNFQEYYNKEESFEIISMKDSTTEFRAVRFQLDAERIGENNVLHKLPNSFYIYFYGSDDSVETLRILSSLDNAYWDDNLQMNLLEKKEWEFKFEN